MPHGAPPVGLPELQPESVAQGVAGGEDAGAVDQLQEVGAAHLTGLEVAIPGRQVLDGRVEPPAPRLVEVAHVGLPKAGLPVTADSATLDARDLPHPTHLRPGGGVYL